MSERFFHGAGDVRRCEFVGELRALLTEMVVGHGLGAEVGPLRVGGQAFGAADDAVG